MTFRIETKRIGEVTTIRLIGRLESECLGEVREQIEHGRPHPVLDLAEVELLGVEVVRFLNDCEEKGLGIQNIRPYIREWMSREKSRRSSEEYDFENR